MNIFQGIIDTIQSYCQFLAQVVSDVTYALLFGLLRILETIIEFIWTYTITIATTTLEALFSNLGIDLIINLAPYVPWFEAANLWFPLSETLVVWKGLTTWYTFVFAYRWIKWAVPFL